jgi:excisionase family DNA binding protein
LRASRAIVAEPAALSLDGALERVVAAVVSEVVRRELGPLREQLAALAAAAPPVLVTVEVAAERLGLSLATVRRQAASGVLPARRCGRSWRIDLGALRPRSTDEIERLAREAREER